MCKVKKIFISFILIGYEGRLNLCEKHFIQMRNTTSFLSTILHIQMHFQAVYIRS